MTTRTVRKDVDRLRALGYPVNASAGVAGGYRLGAGTVAPAAAARRRGGRRRHGRVAHGRRQRRRGGHRGDLAARAGQARAGAPGAPAPPRQRAARLDVEIAPPSAAVPAAHLYGDRRRDPRPRAAALRLRGPPRARSRCARSSRTGSSTRAGAGTWSRGTSIATTGGRSAATGSRPRAGAGARFTPARRPRRRPRRLRRARPRLGDVAPPGAREGARAGGPVIARVPPAVIVEEIDERACFANVGSDSAHDLAMWLALLDADFDASHDLELARELRRLGDRLVRAAG